MRICFYALREYDELAYCEKCKEEFGIDYVYTGYYPSLENAALAKGCEAVSMTPCDMSAELVEAFHSIGVKYITCRSVGYNHVNLEKAKELGMRVSNATYPPDGVANYTIMLMLACLRKLPHILKRVELQDFSLKDKIGKDISSCTIGVLGTGKIGATVIQHLSGFGCKILAYDSYQKDSIKGLAEYTNFETLLKESDLITLHMNATNANYHIVCNESIAKMKEGIVIINTARGNLIDSDALIQGIQSGKIGAAGLDVLENEDGLYYYNRIGKVLVNETLAILRSFPNVVLSPHTAFYTEEDVAGMVQSCFESLYAFEQGEPTTHEIKF